MAVLIKRAYLQNYKLGTMETVDNVVFHQQVYRNHNDRVKQGILMTLLNQSEKFFPYDQYSLIRYEVTEETQVHISHGENGPPYVGFEN